MDFNEAGDYGVKVAAGPYTYTNHFMSLKTDNDASTLPLSFTGQMPFLPPNQQHQSTEGTPH